MHYSYYISLSYSMEAVFSLLWYFELEGLYVFVDLINYPFDAIENLLNDFEVHNTKLLSDVRIISFNKHLNIIFHSFKLNFCRFKLIFRRLKLIFLRLSQHVLKNNMLDVLNYFFIVDELKQNSKGAFNFLVTRMKGTLLWLDQVF